MTEMLRELQRSQRLRRTDLPREAFERMLTCTGCGALMAVFEAATGARTTAEHQHVDADTYRCPSCLGVA